MIFVFIIYIIILVFKSSNRLMPRACGSSLLAFVHKHCGKECKKEERKEESKKAKERVHKREIRKVQ